MKEWKFRLGLSLSRWREWIWACAAVFPPERASPCLHQRTAADDGAPVECQVGQNFDKFWTNVQVLSNICPTFVQVLSMSNICQNNWNFTKFCQKIVNILSKIFVICPKIVQGKSPCPKILVLDKPWTKNVHILSKFCQFHNGVKWLNCLSKLCQDFVQVQFCPTFVQLQFQVT